MKLWQRVLALAAAAAALYLLLRFPPQGASALLLAGLSIWLGRGMRRSKITTNPMGENRDYSLRPVATAALKAAAFMLTTFVWVALAALATRFGYVSDTWHGGGLLLLPALVPFVLSIVHAWDAILRFQFGGPSKRSNP